MIRTFCLVGAAGLALALPAAAQDVPEDLTVMPPVSDAYQPALAAWGVPDLRGSWPINDIADLPVNRPAQYGDRFWKTAEEMAAEQGKVEALEEAYEVEDEQATIGLGHWIEFEAGVRRTSMVVSPTDGRLPEWTDEGRRRSALMRSSWLIGQTYDWTTDFDTYDRCITRGFPAAIHSTAVAMRRSRVASVFASAIHSAYSRRSPGGNRSHAASASGAAWRAARSAGCGATSARARRGALTPVA